MSRDAEDIGYMTDPSFWQMIAERRKHRGGIPLEKVEATLAAEERRLARRKREKSPQEKTGSTRHKASR